MKNLTASLAALALAACNAQTADPAQPYRDALPTAQKVAIGTPQDAGATPGALSSTSQAVVAGGAKAPLAVDSYYLALSVNGGVVWTLAIVRFVTSLPPTTCNDTLCTWGPWVGDGGLNRYELTVSKNGAAFDWKLSAQPVSNPTGAYVDLITGTANPVDKDHGFGTFTVHFDAQTQLDHAAGWTQTDFGTLTVTYDDRTAASVTASFVGAHNQDPNNPCVMNAAYSFVAAVAGGQLQVAFENLTTTGVLSLRTRWGAGGAGRADAHYVGPDSLGNPVEYQESQCWAGRAYDFTMTFDNDNTANPTADDSVCQPFVPASYADIALP